MSKNHKTFAGAILALVLFLGAFIFWQERIVLLGTEVMLATRPVDPRDLFRGEYVILRYEIEQDEKIAEALSGLDAGKNVYLKLETSADGVATVFEVSSTVPDFSTGTWLKGEVSGGGVRFADLEQFFVPEGAGRSIERMRTGLHVKVVVLNGEARVVGLLDEQLNPINPSDYLEE